MVFDYLAGGTLEDLLKKSSQSLPAEIVLRLGRQVSRGLAHLHSGGLIHRDVSPANVWLDERGNAHLGDFDSAIAVDGLDERRPLTTNSFAAPEERNGEHLDYRTDLYSLGGVLQVLATRAHTPGDPDELLLVRPDLPTSYCDLVKRLVARSPDERLATADEVLVWLNHVRDASNVDALISQGEHNQLEFKASLHHPCEGMPEDLQKRLDNGTMQLGQAQSELKRRLNLEVTKTVAAFLNGSGGNLVIGVFDDGTSAGIDADFPYVGRRNTDGWRLSLQDTVRKALSPDPWGVLRVSLVPRDEKLVAIVACPPREVETWHDVDKKKVFFGRMGNETRALEGPDLTTYVRERWPT